jgi:hypothetical protein
MIRYGGANALSKIVHTGTNNLEINAENGGDIVFTGGSNVGIGMTGPGNRLGVSAAQGTTFSSAIIGVRPSATTDTTGLTTISMGTSTVNNYGVTLNAWRFGTDGNPKFALKLHNNSSGGVTALVADSSGQIGIGQNSPGYKLDVSGTIRATGDVIAYSDARVKDNVQTIENALDKVTKLRGVSYTRNDVEDKTTKIGVIAQEVLEVLPEVVQQDDEGKYSVAYGNMVGLLIESIKELKAEVDELKSRL